MDSFRTCKIVVIGQKYTAVASFPDSPTILVTVIEGCGLALSPKKTTVWNSKLAHPNIPAIGSTTLLYSFNIEHKAPGRVLVSLILFFFEG